MDLHSALQEDPQKVVAELEQKWSADQDSLDLNQLLAEVHFELGNAEIALKFLHRSVELDSDGTKGGSNKFLWLGQLVGGRDGLAWFTRGIEGLHAATRVPGVTEEQRAALHIRICSAILGMIEIWMTDLCMEPEAEDQCERLITEGFLLSDTHPELWMTLGSIRISQQRQPEAKQALGQAWELYAAMIDDLDQNHIGSLIPLAQSLLEVGLVEEALEVCGEIHKLDDLVPDPYYLTALAHQQLYMEAKTDQRHADVDPDMSPAETDLQLSKHIVAIKDAVALLLALPPESMLDPEMAEAARALSDELPEPPIPDPYSHEDAEEIVDLDGLAK